MSGLVDQLQADSLDANVSVASLLGKVKICAAKLALRDALDWVDHELNGYYDVPGDDLPEYRKCHGITKAQDKYGRWVPIHFDSSDMADRVSQVFFKEPVSSYEELLRSEGPMFAIPIDTGLVNALANAHGITIVAMRNAVSRGHVHSIVQKVRNLVLDWALELSRAGINGEGMSFSDNERQKATVAHIAIGTFNGSFNAGDASGPNSQINQTFTNDSQGPAFIGELVQAAEAGIDDPQARDAVIKAAKDIAASQDKPSLIAAYERLLACAADHMTIISPYLGPLGKLLAS